MKKMAAIVLISLLPLGCNSLNPIGAVADLINPNKPSIGVEVEAIIGDKKEEVNTQVGNTNNQKAEVINNTSTYDPMILLLLIMGWVLPTPQGMWKGLISFRRKKNVT